MTLAVIGALLGPILVAGGSVSPASAQSEWAPPPTVYLPETGQTLDRVFLDQWREAGGASAYGYPITPEITQDDGTIVQYMQYARFEYYADGDTFGLGDIGEELRPFSLQRSVAAFTSTGNIDGGESAAAAAAIANAWMPVDAASVTNDSVRFVEETSHTVRYGFRAWWEANGEASFIGNPLSEEYAVDGTTYQVFERGQLAWKNGQDAWMVPVGEMLAEKYQLPQEPVAQGDLPTYSEALFVPPPPPEPEPAAAPYGPGPVSGTSKSIVVSISEQRMWAYEGEALFLTSLVSTGKPGFDTPTGMFSISKKVPIQDMEGLIGGEYYNVTDVTDVMYFTTVGHAFHGTYWHNNFGAVMSHGCVNLPMDIASALYQWTPMYTPVQIMN